MVNENKQLLVLLIRMIQKMRALVFFILAVGMR